MRLGIYVERLRDGRMRSIRPQKEPRHGLILTGTFERNSPRSTRFASCRALSIIVVLQEDYVDKANLSTDG
jgi:hypothetical protein